VRLLDIFAIVAYILWESVCWFSLFDNWKEAVKWTLALAIAGAAVVVLIVALVAAV
jgi:hypothetical protein